MDYTLTVLPAVDYSDNNVRSFFRVKTYAALPMYCSNILNKHKETAVAFLSQT